MTSERFRRPHLIRALESAASAAMSYPPLVAVQHGLIAVMPLVLLGAVGLLLLDFPVPGFRTALDALFGPGWRPFVAQLVFGSFGIGSLVVVCSVAVKLAGRPDSPLNAETPTAVGIALASFFVVVAPAETSEWRYAFHLGHGLFVALASAVAATRLFETFARLRWLRLPLGGTGGDIEIRRSLTLVPAGIATVLTFAALRLLCEVNGAGDLQTVVSLALAAPFLHLGAGLGLGLGYILVSQALWLIGVHGPNLLYPIEERILIPAGLANASAASWGDPIPHVLTKTFFDVFVRIGGSGSTLALVFAVFLASRDRGLRRICAIALLPALCNVNEPLLFGIPLVLNPAFALPFVAVPLVQTGLAWGATLLGWVPATTVAAVWTTPPLLNAWVATGHSFAGPAMQLVNLAVGVAVYVPFVRWSDRLRGDQGRRAMSQLLVAAESHAAPERALLHLGGRVGALAATLAADLETALARREGLFLEYQPQVDAGTGAAIGVEALLRWSHPVFGRVPPPIAVALAEEIGRVDALGAFVVAEACRQRGLWRGRVPDALAMSINVAPRQLLAHDFAAGVLGCIAANGLEPRQIELEITESTVLSPQRETFDALQLLRSRGARIAIDDFGMGHTSLRYLHVVPIDTLKIDRSLTVASDVNDHIVHSIVDLTRSLGIATVVEGVETPAQLDRFLGLGCRIVQGYLYCPPVSADACLAFVAAAQAGDGGRGSPL